MCALTLGLVTHAFASMITKCDVLYPTHTELAADYTRMEVSRMAPPCLQTTTFDRKIVHEGLSTGFPGDVRYPRSSQAADPSRLWPYGCWFFANARGSGVFIDVGRSLRFDNRSHAALSVDALFPNVSAADGFASFPGDKLWCYVALMHGYDSIQIAREFGWLHEIVACSGCDREPSLSACPPAARPVYNSSNATAPCECDPARTVVNCGERQTREATTCASARPAISRILSKGCSSTECQLHRF